MGAITRREAMKGALKAGAYAAPVILTSQHVSAATALVSGRTITFAPAPGSPFPVGTDPTGIVVGDFNDDGRLDLAVSNNVSGNVSVLLGTGSGSFTNAPGSPFPVGNAPNAIAVGDFNGDGKLDLAVTASIGINFTVSVFLGNGNGSFTNAPGSPIPVGASPDGIAVGDFNGDGKLDLAIINLVGYTVSVLLGTGNGGFTNAPGSPFATGPLPAGVVAGDFNGDSKLDLAIVRLPNPTPPPPPFHSTVSVLFGNGSGGFAAPGPPFLVGNSTGSIVVGDFNGDRKLDLAITNVYDNTLSVLLGTGSGSFTNAPSSPFPVSNRPSSIAVGDFDGDGRLDLAVVNTGSNTVSVFLGNGDGRFAALPGSPFLVGNSSGGIVVGDFNGDGKLDFAVTNPGSNSVSVLLQQ